MPASRPIPFEGVLNCWNDEHDLPDLLLAVHLSGSTGRLLFSNAEADKTLFVKEGNVVFAESSSDDDGLGQYLLRSGTISLHDFTRVSKRVEPGKRLGALLVAEGVLEPKELVPAVVGQVRAIILGLFRRTETWYGFKSEEITAKEAIALDMPMAQLVIDGIQGVESWRRISKGVGSLDSVYRLAEGARAEWSRVQLDPSVTELFTMLEEPKSVADVCTEARLPDLDACRYLWAFRVLEWVEAVEVQAAPGAVESLHEEPTALPVEREAPAMPPSSSGPAEPTPGTAAKIPPIPQRLVETRPSANRQNPPVPKSPGAPRASKPAATTPMPPPPRPVPKDLAHTVLDVGRGNGPRAESAPKETPPSPAPATTAPEVPRTPRRVSDTHVRTQFFVTPPSVKEENVPEPSAGEMMEAILEEEDDAAPATPTTPPTAARPALPGANASTQLFDGPVAFDRASLPEDPPGEQETGATPSFDDENYEDFFTGDFADSFAAVSLDYASSPSVEPPRGDETSFPESAPSASEPVLMAEPLDPEPVAVEDAAGGDDAPIPIVEGALVAPEPEPAPSPPSGMELFAMTDPFLDRKRAAGEPPPFTTDPESLQFSEEPEGGPRTRRDSKPEGRDRNADGSDRVNEGD